MNPQAIKIYKILQDFEWHCPIEWGYADGHTKRITDINRYLKPKGQHIVSDWCDCGRHTARVLKRRITQNSAPGREFYPKPDKCCVWNGDNGLHAINCSQRQEVKIKQGTLI